MHEQQPSISAPPPAEPSNLRETKPDPGSSTSRVVALVLAIMMAVLAIGWQNAPEAVQYRLIGQTPPEPPETTLVVGFDQAEIMGKMTIKMADFVKADPNSIPTLEKMAFTDPQQLIVAIATGELADASAAIEKLDELIAVFQEMDNPGDEPDGPDKLSPAELLRDATDLRLLYADGADALGQASSDRLVERYDYFARVALTHGLEKNDPARTKLRTGGVLAAVFLGFVALAFLAGFFIGIGLLVFGIIRIGSGKMRPAGVRPMPGGSVFLETYALFIAGFLVLTVGMTWLSGVPKYAPYAGQLSLGLQWLLLAIPFWPLIRGMSWADYKQAIGLHTGRGLIREMLTGVLMYFATIPLYVVGIGVTVVLIVLRELILGPPEGPATNPIMDLIMNADALTLILVGLLAVVWAPLCEELVFRGALHRHLRGRLHWFVAALFGGLLFAFMHSYGPLMLTPLVVLGFSFSFMREWRGSLVPSMTAHALHNATLVGLMVLLVKLVFA